MPDCARRTYCLLLTSTMPAAALQPQLVHRGAVSKELLDTPTSRNILQRIVHLSREPGVPVSVGTFRPDYALATYPM